MSEIKAHMVGAAIGEKRSVPGEKSAVLMKLREQYVPKGVYQVAPVFIKQSKGSVIEDVDGNQFLDFTGGIGVLNVGHANDRVVTAIKEQAEKHLHTCFHAVMYESYVKVAQKLVELTPGDFPKQAMLVNSGAEAVENAIKIARRYTGRYGIIAFEYAFHGRTSIGMGLTSQVKNYKRGFGPFDPGIQRFQYAYAYRAPFSATPEEYGEYCVKRIEDSFKTYMPAEEIAAVIVEPFLGEGGYVAPPQSFIKGLRRICDENDILLIADEIQSGMGRTGKMWAIEHYGVVPDMLTSAKSLGGGTVLSAVIARKEIMESVDVGGLGGTYSGNPLSCVAALAVFEEMEEKELVARAATLGEMVTGKLKEMQQKYKIMGDVRGLGSSIAIEFVLDRNSKVPASAECNEIRLKCLERGLLVMTCGVAHNCFRLMYPLVIEEAQLQQGLAIIEDAIREVNQKVA